MLENEFEKQVRKKMEQLDFDPSESVWANVDKEINKEKKRRVPLFWLYFLPGLLLAGGAYYFVSNKNETVKLEKLPEQAEITKKQSKETASQSLEPRKNIRGGTNDKAANDALGTAHNTVHVAIPGSANQKPADHSGKQGFAKKETPVIGGLTKEKNANRKEKDIPGEERNKSLENSAAAGAVDIVINNYSDQSAKAKDEKTSKNNVDTAAGTIISATKENKSKKDSVRTAATVKNNEQKTKYSSWKIGYTLNAGVSNVNQDLFNSVKTLSTTTNLASSPPGTINRGTVTYSSSPIHAGFSFAAGAFVTRDLSKRFSFSAGINYHYYSTKMNTGDEVDAAQYSANAYSPFIPGSIYYENGNSQSFTNQYHFIELPLSVNYRLNKSKQTPLIWELGFTPAYIISSNALYYDPITNLYSNKYLQPNKMQLNGVTAVMIGFPLHTGVLQIGPQVQYGFTGFVNTNDGNPGHLFYAGLKISFIPGKK